MSISNFNLKDAIELADDEILLVKRSWRMLQGIDPAIIGETFYSKLFSDNPAVRKMFPSEMRDQYKKLVDMISIIVARLDRIHELADDIARTAAHHHQYGVRTNHYKLVGDALLWTLEQGLGNSWTPAVKDAWAKCYISIANLMSKAAGQEKST
ncbi:MAG TPA: globin domain-containing protein [Chitinophagaceae bacterium]|nr:globin domain-containing protein [Chitinophagaceae bacterium]